jgi:hypothetical protein
VASAERSMPRELPYPPSRRLTFDVGRLGRSRHRVHALLEVDVTDARARIRARRRGGEIEMAKAQAVVDEGDLVLGRRRDPLPMRVFLRLPQALRLALMRIGLGLPRRTMSAMGNVMVTTVGMAGRARGWIVPSSVHPLCVALGSLGEKPAVQDGQIVARTILNMTVLIDHDVVDGVPAARFVADAVRRLEAAAGA